MPACFQQGGPPRRPMPPCPGPTGGMLPGGMVCANSEDALSKHRNAIPEIRDFIFILETSAGCKPRSRGKVAQKIMVRRRESTAEVASGTVTELALTLVLAAELRRRTRVQSGRGIVLYPVECEMVTVNQATPSLLRVQISELRSQISELWREKELSSQYAEWLNLPQSFSYRSQIQHYPVPQFL
jgi:hypothetical protein